MTRHALPLLLILLAGCSPRDPPTSTPAFHAGPQTGTSAPINSWEIGQNTHAPTPKAPAFAPEPSQRGFEPYDALAEKVYAALQNDGTVPVKYLTATAKGTVVRLTGTVATNAQKQRAVEIARGVPGVKHVQARLRVHAL